MTGEILIRSGKGRKPRYVYLGKTARKALRRYLKGRQDISKALWVTQDSDRFTYFGLREVIRRRAKQVGIKAPTLHDFRRGFALAMLREHVDVYTLARLMGHEGIGVLCRYLKLTDADTLEAHRRASPVDNL
jgi:integrase/recombinase XerD